MNYKGHTLKNTFTIEELYSIHYFEYMSNFSFAGESHDFWEFICVDKGEVEILMGETCRILKKGEIAFHKPNEFHKVEATGFSAPNLVVISFQCRNLVMDFFKDKVLKIDESERNLLADIIIEARQAFSSRLDDPYLTTMTLRDNETPGAQQLIRLYLEQFLIHLFRRYSTPVSLANIDSQLLSKSTKLKSDTEIFNRIVNYMELHLSSRLSVEQISKDNIIGRSQLQKLFQEKTGLGVIEYFLNLKIESAKQMIRTGHMNFTQISEQLGYSSIHYFSRQFKKITDMTPSEYASSIKAMADGSF